MPPRRRTLDAVVKAAEKVLRSNGVDHVFVGGITVLAFGTPRTTSDVDVIADITPAKVTSIASAFHRLGFLASAQDLHDALIEGGHCTIQDSRSAYHIDLVPASTEGHRAALRTKRRVAWRGRELPMAAPEHTIVVKLQWGSDQDLEDAFGMYVRQKGTLDVRMMRAFAAKRGMSRELTDLEDRAGRIVGRRRGAEPEP
jgi:hypothetical protein